jgi:hypothetical protein
MTQSDAELVLKHCAYWHSLKGLGASQNLTTQTVYFPRKNIFSPDALRYMMEQTSNGLEL